MPVADTRLTDRQQELLIQYLPVARQVAEKWARGSGLRRDQLIEEFESVARLGLARALSGGTALTEALAWTVADRRCSESARMDQRWKRPFGKQHPALLQSDEDDPLASAPDHRPDETGRRDLPPKVVALLDGLDEDDRELIDRHVKQEESFEAIAESRGEDKSKVRRRYEKLMKILRGEADAVANRERSF